MGFFSYLTCGAQCSHCISVGCLLQVLRKAERWHIELSLQLLSIMFFKIASKMQLPKTLILWFQVMWDVQPFNDITACHKAHINTISELRPTPAAFLPVMQLTFHFLQRNTVSVWELFDAPFLWFLCLWEWKWSRVVLSPSLESQMPSSFCLTTDHLLSHRATCVTLGTYATWWIAHLKLLDIIIPVTKGKATAQQRGDLLDYLISVTALPGCCSCDPFPVSWSCGKCIWNACS